MFGLSKLRPSAQRASVSPTSLALHSVRSATVVVGGSSKNHGTGKCHGKRRGPKVVTNQGVGRHHILVTQRHWIEESKQWHAGFNVRRGRSATLNATRSGLIMYTYDTVKKRKFVHVIPGSHKREDYMRPFYDPKELEQLARERVVRRLKLDPSVSAVAKNNRLRDTRMQQLDLLKKVEHRPIEATMKQYGEQFAKLNATARQMESLTPDFEEEQKRELVVKQKMVKLHKTS